MHGSDLYRCGLEDVWQREIGDLRPIRFARKIGGCEDLIKRLVLYTKLEGHDGSVGSVHFSPSGDLLVSGSEDREIIIWDWAAKKKKLSYSSGHKGNVFQARIMPFADDRSIVSCGSDCQVRHSQILENGRVETKKLAKHKGRVHKLAVEPGSPRTFFSCGDDGVVQHFDLREEKSNKLLTCHAFPGSKHRRRRTVIRLHAMVINPRNPNYITVGGDDEYARIYDMRKVGFDGPEIQPVDSFSPAHLINNQAVRITSMEYSKQEELLVSYNDELIYKFDKDMGMGPDPISRGNGNPDSSGNIIQDSAPCVYEGHRNGQTMKGVNFFGPNSEYVVSGSDCGRVFIWKKLDSKLVAMLPGDFDKVVNCLEPHPFITVLATGGIDRMVKVWSPISDQLVPLPSDAAKVMERNKRWREEGTHRPHPHPHLGPSVIMHVMRLQRRDEREVIDRFHVAMRGEYDEDEDGDNPNGISSDDDSYDEEARVNPRECIIS